MIAETKKKLTQLVEINSVLASDLNECRRKIVELSQERDILKEKVVELEQSVSSQHAMGVQTDNFRKTEQLRRRVVQEQKRAEEMRHERDLALRHMDEEKARADLSEQRLHTLTMKLREVVRERNTIMTQLDESTAAMDEIRYYLSASISNPDRDIEAEFEC